MGDTARAGGLVPGWGGEQVRLRFDPTAWARDGQATTGVTIGQLTRLAGALAVEPAVLLASNVPPFAPDKDPDADVARLACLLLVAGGTVSRDITARTLGWTLPRLAATLDGLEGQAPLLGVQLHRHGFSIRLIRAEQRAGFKLATFLRRDQVTRSTKARTARLAHALVRLSPAGTPSPQPTPRSKTREELLRLPQARPR